MDWILRKVLTGWMVLAALVRSHPLLMEVKAGSWGTYPPNLVPLFPALGVGICL